MQRNVIVVLASITTGLFAGVLSMLILANAEIHALRSGLQEADVANQQLSIKLDRQDVRFVQLQLEHAERRLAELNKAVLAGCRFGTDSSTSPQSELERLEELLAEQEKLFRARSSQNSCRFYVSPWSNTAVGR